MGMHSRATMPRVCLCSDHAVPEYARRPRASALRKGPDDAIGGTLSAARDRESTVMYEAEKTHRNISAACPLSSPDDAKQRRNRLR